MRTWSDCVVAADVGGIADTFQAVGTITLNEHAKMIHGLWMAAAPITTTAAEANLGQFDFNFTSLQASSFLTSGPPSTGSATATQSQGNKMEVMLLATKIPARANARIPITFSTHVPDPTAGCSVVAGILYSDGSVPPDFGRFWPRVAPSHSADSEATANASSTGTTNLTALDIPAWATMILGISRDSNHDAAGATTEEMVGTINFASASGISGFAPQIYPLPTISAPLAGTLAGTGNWTPNLMDTTWPLIWDVSSIGDVSTTPGVSLNATVSGAVAHSASIYWEGRIG